jgi:hypothetical protein
MEQDKRLIEDFFRSLKCDVSERGDLILIKGIPDRVQKMFMISDRIDMDKNNLSSDLLRKIKDYLKNNPSKTLLKIDFEFPSNIKDKIHLRNCSISKVEKKHENNYFSRFSFLTSFRSLNHTEQILNEIFVHEGKVVSGNLEDYNIKEGKVEEASTEHLSVDYNSAKEKLKELLHSNIEKISTELNEKLTREIERVNEHYDKILGEFNLNKSRAAERIKEAEKVLKNQPVGQQQLTPNNELVEKITRMKEAFEHAFSDINSAKITDEIKAVIDNEKSKYSLDVDNKLINTTIIYYPIFKIILVLEEAGFVKNVEVIYNPLTEELTSFVCDSCKTALNELNVCHGGHICCGSCLHSCSECGKRFCRLCFAGVCNSCGKLVCKNCARKCSGCEKLVCKNCMRKTGMGGEKCSNCVAYCPICSNIVEKNTMVRGSDGRMVCRGCGNKRLRK